MKTIYFSVLLLICGSTIAQDKQQQLLADNNIRSMRIEGVEYNKGKISKQTFNLEEFDQYGNTTVFKAMDEDNNIKTEIVYNYSPDGNTRYEKQFDKAGELKYTFVTITNREDRSLRRLQIGTAKDTFVDQTRYRGVNLKDSIMYSVKFGARVLDWKWEYDDEGRLIGETRYDGFGDPMYEATYTYEIEGDCVKRFDQDGDLDLHECISGNTEVLHMLRTFDGFLYGLRLPFEEGGKMVTTKTQEGLDARRQYFSKKGDLMAEITYTYQK
ncbi:hypothetical protein [Gilvibacter sediminis]|uniref:hypothetical protein n=1 Tax=Gilvibacter sediminis TaxID=379071 RepID=UPI00234FDFD1|nr:hypothetical protein [Gilvibacter sediminis]MDC7998034.1 hypothetical protein [Gilvibacter sediminis]